VLNSKFAIGAPIVAEDHENRTFQEGEGVKTSTKSAERITYPSGEKKIGVIKVKGCRRKPSCRASGFEGTFERRQETVMGGKIRGRTVLNAWLRPVKKGKSFTCWWPESPREAKSQTEYESAKKLRRIHGKTEDEGALIK